MCGAKLGRTLIDLPRLPLTEIFVKKKQPKGMGFVDQQFYVCDTCHHGQLGTIVDPKFLYNSDAYFFRTGESKTAPAANDFFLNFIMSHVRSGRIGTIIDVGCSDLYLLNALRGKAKRLVGIDPVLKGREEELSDDQMTVIGDFLENIDMTKYMGDDTLVISSHTMEHIKDPSSVISQLFDVATDKTQFMFQFPSLEPVLTDRRFDQIFHQHLQLYSKDSFTYLVENHGGEVVDTTVNYFHWGALLVSFRKSAKKSKPIKISTNSLFDRSNILESYGDYKARMSVANRYIQSLSNEKVYGFGATLMLPILAYHLGNDLSSFESILDDDQSKHGHFYLNLPVAIASPESVRAMDEATVVVTAYNTARSVMPRVLHLRPKRIVLPMQMM